MGGRAGVIGAAWLALAVLMSGCSGKRPTRPPVLGLSESSKQVLVVSLDGSGPSSVQLTAYDQDDNGWHAGPRVVRGVIGRNGFAAPGEKREGDGKTPTGIFPVKLAFSYDSSLETLLPVRLCTKDSYWVDDPESPEYNRWVYGLPKARSYERMRRDDDLYKVGLVIEYNTDPVVPGRGSAIFMHVWKGPDVPTAGCVALSETDLRAFLFWLSPKQSPVIALNQPTEGAE